LKYWSWSKVHNDYYHREKDGSCIWASSFRIREMDEAQRYAELSKHADLTGTARGCRVSFSKAPSSLGLLTRRINPGSCTASASFASPKMSPDYKITFSPTFYSASAPGIRLGYLGDTHESETRRITLVRAYDGGKEGSPISGVSLSKEGVFAPSIRTYTREVNPAKVSRDTRIISHIRVVTHDASSHTKSPKTTRNHWSIYLILVNQAGTIRVNMTISESNTEILEWTLLSYPLSLSKIREWNFRTVPDITVANFWKLIHDNGRQRYLMDGGDDRAESRFWIYAVIADLVRQRWLMNEQAAEEIWEYLQHFYSLNGSSKRIGMAVGMFY